MGFLSSIFGHNRKENAHEDKQNVQKKFEIFKYDGMRAQRMGRMDYAIQCFCEALKIEEDFETMTYLSQTYIQTGKLERAHQLLHQMKEKEPTHIPTLLTLGHICYLLEEYKEMAEVAQKAIAIEEGNAMAHYLLGKATDGLGDSIMSIAHLTKSIILKEDFIEARLMRAEALLKLNQPTEAMEDINAILSYNPDDENALLLKGKISEVAGKEEKAEQIYKHITELNPFNEQAFLYLGNLFIIQGKYSEAITLFDEAIEFNPNSSNAFHERGRAKLLNGDKVGSFEDMKKAVELAPQEMENLNGQFNNQTLGNQSNVLGL